MKKTKIFFINGLLLTCTSFILRGIGMIFNLYISNKIGSEALGVFSLIMSVYMFATTLASSGLNFACTSIVSEQFAKGNFLDGLKAVKTCLIFSLLLGLGTNFIVIAFSQLISINWLKSMISCTPLYLIAISLPFISVSSIINGYFSSVRKSYKSAFTQVFEFFVKALASILLLNFYADSKSVESICVCLILADVISEICSCSLLLFLYQKDKLKYSKRAITNITFKKKILKTTIPISITSYIRSGLSTLKQFIVPNRLMLAGLSYSFALSEYGKINGMTMGILMFPNVFISSFSNLLIPEITSLLANQYKKRILEVCKKAFLATSIFSLLIFIIFFFFADKISLTVFHNLDCAEYIKILSPLIFFMYSDNITDNILKGLNKQFNVMICNVLNLILSICLLYFLLPILGINGYLLSIAISETLNFIISFFQLYKVIKI